MIRAATFFLTWVMLAASSKAAEVKDSLLRLRLPDGFVECPQAKNSPDIIYAFIKGDPTDSELDIIIQIEKFPGVIGREKMSKDQISANADATLFIERWKSFEVEGCRVRETFGAITTVTRNVQVPLKPNAIQIKVIGEESRDTELASIVRAILNNLDGETNWLTSEERVSKLLTGGGRVLLLLALLAAACVALIRRLRKRATKE
ncbi:MAG: hypothetical protein ABIF82_03680 [Planctomycetota bacterium]